MKHTLFHALECPYSRRTRIVVAHTGVAVDEVEVPIGAKPAWYQQQVDAHGRVPVLVAGDEPIPESAVIMEYLDEHAGRLLSPRSPLERARMRLMMRTADDAWMPVFHRFGDGPAREYVFYREEAYLNALADLERDLRAAPGPFLFGTEPSLADAAYASTVPRVAPHLPRELPAVHAWLAAVRRWDAWQSVEETTTIRR